MSNLHTRPLVDYPLDNLVSNILQNFGMNWNPSLQGYENLLELRLISNPSTAI